jgi:hypothetical protein
MRQGKAGVPGAGRLESVYPAKGSDNGASTVRISAIVLHLEPAADIHWL